MSNAPQRVTIIGPNLRDQSKGTFHVHAEGCADIKRMASREPEYLDGWTVSATSVKDVVTDVYDPDNFGWNEDDPQEVADYASEFYFFPCCHLS
jgi:hypothetical protein